MKNRRLGFMAEMNMTSLADVSFTLMIIFLIAGVSTAISRRQGIEMDLPRASTLDPQRKEGLTVRIKTDGKIYVERQLTTRQGFSKAFADWLAREDYDRVYVEADKTVDYGVVMGILGDIREQGMTNIGLVALPK